MRQQIDIEFDSTNADLDISTGDFTMVESTGQHQRQLLLNNQGDFKQNPLTGIGLNNYIDDEGPADLIRTTTQQLQKDGMTIVNLQSNSNGLADTTIKIFENAFYP